MDPDIVGAEGAKSSCVYEKAEEQAPILPAASLAFTVKLEVELALTVTITL